MATSKRAWVITMQPARASTERRVVGVLPATMSRRVLREYLAHLHDHLTLTVPEQLRWLYASHDQLARRSTRYHRLACDFYGAAVDEGAAGLDQRSWGCEIGETLVLRGRQGVDVHAEGFVEDNDVVLVWTEVSAHGERRTHRASLEDGGGWLRTG